MIEFTGGGFHNWLFLQENTSLELAYQLKKVLKKTILENLDIETEIFPKQDQISEDSFGNFVRLPFGYHQTRAYKSRILDNFDVDNIEGYKIKLEDLPKIEPKIKQKTIAKLPSYLKDVLTGIDQIEKIDNEHVKWKIFFHDLINFHNFIPDDIFPYLKKNQTNFDIQETLTQLKHCDFEKIHYKNETRKKYFPNYEFGKNNNYKPTIDNRDLTEQILYEQENKDQDILTLRDSKEFCTYNNGVYLRNRDTFIEQIIIQKLKEFGRSPSEITFNSLKRDIRVQTYKSISEFDKNPNIINFRNGLFDIEKWELKPHDKEYYSFRQIPHDYKEDASSPIIDKFLEDIFHEDDIEFIEEAIGLSLIPEMKYQKAFMLWGRGNNGKTTFLNLLTYLVGINNKAGVSLLDLDKQFEQVKLEGKLVNVVSDIGSTKIGIRKFKQYVGNELTITCNRKFKDAYEQKPCSKLWYSCNSNFPQLPPDTDKGFWRKWTLTETPNDFDLNEDKDIFIKLTNENEMSGLINKALRGLKRLIERKGFDDKYNNWLDVRDLWMLKIDDFKNFLKENANFGEYKNAKTDPTNEFWETKEFTVKKMNEYLKDDSKIPNYSQNKITRLINQDPRLGTTRRKYMGKTYHIYTGFKLQDKYTQPQSSLNM